MSTEARLALGLGRYLLDDLAARWCASSVAALAEGRDVPVYGSVEWQQADIRLQVAAAVRAGEAYRRDGLYLPVALADALAAEQHADEVIDAEEFRTLAKQVQAMGSPSRRSHAELVALRAEVARPGTAA